MNIAPDVTPVVPYPANNADSKANGVGFFAYNRAQYNMLGFVSGVIQAAADEVTSESMLVPDALKGLTLANLQQLKDPWGRNYLQWAQDYGPAAWGVS